MKLDKKSVRTYCESVYKYLNGKINHVIKAEGIRFEETNVRLDVDEVYSPVIGRASIVFITIYIDELIEFLKLTKKEFKKEGVSTELLNSFIRGFMIHNIAHELCHIDQDGSRYGKNPMILETSNELMTIEFLEKNHEKLEDKFGEFSMDFIRQHSVYLRSTVNPQDYPYYRFENYRHCVKVAFQRILRLDIDRFSENGIKSLYFSHGKAGSSIQLHYATEKCNTLFDDEESIESYRAILRYIATIADRKECDIAMTLGEGGSQLQLSIQTRGMTKFMVELGSELYIDNEYRDTIEKLLV